MDLLLNLEGVLVAFEGLGQADVDLFALGRLIEDIAEGVDALHEAGGDFICGALLLTEPD